MSDNKEKMTEGITKLSEIDNLVIETDFSEVKPSIVNRYTDEELIKIATEELDKVESVLGPFENNEGMVQFVIDAIRPDRLTMYDIGMVCGLTENEVQIALHPKDEEDE